MQAFQQEVLRVVLLDARLRRITAAMSQKVPSMNHSPILGKRRSPFSKQRRNVSVSCLTFGGIDVLANNAGAFVAAPIERFPMKDFEKLIAVNIRGVFVARQGAARRVRQGARIIHIGSCNSLSVPFAGGSVYALTKARSPVLPRALPATFDRAASRSTTFSPARWIPI
jgi:NAD(P)-dependent dehydrogenase (short-subunit alcohol dehydrogenase family)